MSARTDRARPATHAGPTPGPAREQNDPDTTPVNDARLRGRLAAVPEPRELPSGDLVATFRLIIDRPATRRRTGSSARVDTIDCAAYRGDLRRRISSWQPGDVVEVEGSVHRRFFRAGGAPASRYEVEVSSATRVSRVARKTRATMAE